MNLEDMVDYNTAPVFHALCQAIFIEALRFEKVARFLDCDERSHREGIMLGTLVALLREYQKNLLDDNYNLRQELIRLKSIVVEPMSIKL